MGPAQPSRWRALRSERVLLAIAVLVPMLIGVAIAAWNLGAKPLWYDETFEALMVMRPPYEFARFVATFETSGGAYHALLWVWKFLGTSEAMLRVPSLVSAVAAVPVVFAIGRRFLSTPWAGVAALLLVLNGFWVHYAQEARPYGFWLLTASLSTLALIRAVEQPSRGRWVVYGLVTVVAVWSHLMTGFIVAGQVLAMLLHPGVRQWWRPAAAAVAVAAISAVPIVISAMLANESRWAWIPRPSPDGLWRGLNTLSGSLGDPVAQLWLAVLAFGLAAVAFRAWRGGRPMWALLLVVTWALLPIVGPWLASYIRPMYTPRYLFAVLPAVVLVNTFGLSVLRPRLLAAGMVVILLVVGSIGVVRWHERVDREDWRTATALVLERSRPADGITFFTVGTFNGGAMYEYRYYLSQFDSGERPTVVRLANTDAPIEQRVREAIAGLPRLWVIGSEFDSPSAISAIEEVEGQFELAEEWTVVRLDIRLYVRAMAQMPSTMPAMTK
jgi:mannosyltransferase